MVLGELFKLMGAEEHFDRVVVTALVFDTLKVNRCVTGDNIDAVKKALMKDVCSEYELDVLLLSAYWGNDLSVLLAEHLGIDMDIYKKYIWKYLSENEVYPGVKMSVDLVKV